MQIGLNIIIWPVQQRSNEVCFGSFHQIISQKSEEEPANHSPRIPCCGSAGRNPGKTSRVNRDLVHQLSPFLTIHNLVNHHGRCVHPSARLIAVFTDTVHCRIDSGEEKDASAKSAVDAELKKMSTVVLKRSADVPGDSFVAKRVSCCYCLYSRESAHN